MTVREDFDRLAHEAEEAAIRAQFGRLSSPRAVELAADCVDTAAGLLDAGKLISEGGLGIPQPHRGDVSLAREALDFALDLKRLGQSLAAYAKFRRGPVRAKATLPVKSQGQLHAERVRRFERDAMRQQGLPVPYDAEELRERVQAEAAERVRERARRDEEARRVRAFHEEQSRQMGWGVSLADEAARNEDLGRREALARGLTIEEA